MPQVIERPCHRCGAMLDPSCPFCGQCGAPQLTVPQQDLPELSASAQDASDPDASASGPLTPPLGLQWKPAVFVCFLVAVASSILCIAALAVPALDVVSFFWTLSGAMIALALYQRRVPLAALNAGIGARIGMLAGIFMAFGAAAVSSIFLLLMRYLWHRSNAFDAQITDAIHQGMARAAENNPDPQLVRSSLAFLLSPDGRAGYTLSMAAFLALLLVVFSTLSGAVGARLTPRRRAKPIA